MMKKSIRLFLVVAVAFSLAACGKDKDQPVGSVTLDRTQLTFKRGESATLAATVAPVHAANKTLMWRSSDTQVATVSDAGLVTAVEPGTATITAATGGKSATCTVNVEPDVYIVGHQGIGMNFGPRQGLLWKNGVAEELPFHVALSVFVSEGDVYITGYQSSDDQTTSGIWMNGTLTELPDCYPASVFVSDKNVYVAGTNYKQQDVAELWVNGVPSMPNESNSYLSDANSVFVSDQDVYVAGQRRNSDNTVAICWKNGVATELTARNTVGEARSVFVSEGIVYVAGYEYVERPENIDRFRREATLWTDGVPTYLSEGEAYSVFVSDKGDIYVAGLRSEPTMTVAMLWKNGEPIPLGENGTVQSVFVYGNDVYAAGYLYLDNKNQPVVWKNGEATLLPEGNYAYSIYVY